MELRATVSVVGGGPAGMMLGLLLARAGIEVTVLEKHADFLRDFRGDTVHPSTIQLLDELGLAERFHELPHHKVPTADVIQGNRRTVIADFAGLLVRYPYVAMVPQWDLLDLLAAEAARYPTFGLRMRSEAYDVIREDGRVAGVRFRDADGDHELRSALVVGADGRHSATRRAVGLRSRQFGAPMDVLWFRLSRRADDPGEDLGVRLGAGLALVVINRTSYWQIAYVIPKGGYERLREQGVEVLRTGVAQAAPFLADRVGEIASVDDTSMLEVRVDRLPRWYAPGVLVIGDAAHAMSPVGGIGINLAVQDAVAAANILAEPLARVQRRGAPVDDRVLAAVQRRRRFPTVVTQAFQRAVQRFGVQRALRADPGAGGRRLPTLPARLPVVPRLTGRLIGVGVRPEHVRTPVRSTSQPG